MDEEQMISTPENYTPPDFIIETVTDEAGIRATMPTMLRGIRYRLNLIFAILLLLLAPSLFLMQEYVLAVCMVIVSVCCFILHFRLPGQAAERQLARLRESYGTEAVPCQLVFWPQGVVINNHCSGGSAQLRYEIVRTITLCGDYLTFRTVENQSVILRMQDIADQPEFLPYFLGKCPQAKKINL